MNGRIVALDVKLEEVENSSRVKVKAGNALEAEVSNLEEQLSAKAQKRMLAAKAAKMTPPNTKLEGEILPDSELEEEPLPTTELVGDTPPDTRWRKRIHMIPSWKEKSRLIPRERICLILSLRERLHLRPRWRPRWRLRRP